MRVLVLVDNPSVLELDVEVLVDGVERAADGQVVLELHRHLLPHELLEVGEEQLHSNQINRTKNKNQHKLTEQKKNEVGREEINEQLNKKN